MASQREIKAVAKVLGSDENGELSAEEVAERAIEAYEEEHSKSHNLIVLGHFRLNETESYVAAVGPLSTRAPARAREVGERFAWDYKTRRGTGKFTLVPLLRDPKTAWDSVRPKAAVPAGEVREAFIASPSLSRDPFGPTCICGLTDQFVCPRHPEGREGDS